MGELPPLFAAQLEVNEAFRAILTVLDFFGVKNEFLKKSVDEKLNS